MIRQRQTHHTRQTVDFLYEAQEITTTRTRRDISPLDEFHARRRRPVSRSERPRRPMPPRDARVPQSRAREAGRYARRRGLGKV